MMAKNKKKIFYGWWVVLALFTMVTLTVPFTSALVSLYLIPITEEFGIARSAFTLTTTIIAICGIVLSPVVGSVVEKYNLKLILTISTTVFALAYMSYGLAQNVFHLYISAAILGVSFIFCGNLTAQILVVNWFNKSRGLAMSIVIAGIGFGGFALSPIISTLIQTFDWRQTYFIMGIVILVICLPLIWFVIKKSPQEIGLQRFGDDEANGGEDKKGPGVEINITPSEARKEPFFYLFMIAIFILGLLTTGTLQQINPYISDFHGMTFAAIIVSIFSLLGIPFKLGLGTLSDKFGAIKAGSLGYIFMSIALILLLFGGSKTMLLIMAVFFAFGNAVATVCTPLFTSYVFGTNNYGVMMGIVNSVFQVGMALGGVLTGAVYDLFGSYVWAWVGLTIANLLSLACIILSYKLSRKKFAAGQNA